MKQKQKKTIGKFRISNVKTSEKISDRNEFNFFLFK